MQFRLNGHEPVGFGHPLAPGRRAGFQKIRAHGHRQIGDEIRIRFAAAVGDDQGHAGLGLPGGVHGPGEGARLIGLYQKRPGGTRGHTRLHPGLVGDEEIVAHNETAGQGLLQPGKALKILLAQGVLQREQRMPPRQVP